MDSTVSAPVPLESPACLLCGGLDFTIVLEGLRDWVWRKPGVFTLARCTACGLVITRPRPTAEGLGFYYDGAYSAGADGTQSVDMAGFYTGFFGRLLNRYRLVPIEKALKLGAQDHMPDAGCSQGFFLDTAYSSAGCAVWGSQLCCASHQMHRVLGWCTAARTPGALVHDAL